MTDKTQRECMDDWVAEAAKFIVTIDRIILETPLRGRIEPTWLMQMSAIRRSLREIVRERS